MLNILDASVSAHLLQFNVNEDLSISPNLFMNKDITGLQIALKFLIMKIALLGYGRMGKEIEKHAKKRNHQISFILDKDFKKVKLMTLM